jgi:hypothetical protein
MVAALDEELTDLEEDLIIDDYGLWLQVTELKNKEREGTGLIGEVIVMMGDWRGFARWKTVVVRKCNGGRV